MMIFILANVFNSFVYSFGLMLDSVCIEAGMQAADGYC